MTPLWTITADGADITAALRRHFVSLTHTDKTGMESDEIEVVIVDNGAIALPRRGAMLRLAIGWTGAALVDKGRYQVDEIRVGGYPETITIKGRAAAFMGPIKAQRDLSYHDTTLGAVLAQVAERNGLTLAMGPDLAAQAVPHIDQTNESDANFITRLAQDYGATGTIKDGRLVFVREGAGQGASGVTLPGATLARAECDPYDFGVVEREGSTTGIKAKWRDKAKNETVSELAGEEGSVKTLKRDFATREEAQAAAKAEWARVARSAHEFSATLPMGRPDLIAGQPLALEGFRREIKAVPWVLGNITNTITDGGFSTTIEAKERADQPK